ncbi:histone H2A-Bbd type 1-like [Mus pahari]|uniref:histone H2A-Bbd type 1-like n=1 Tax=Mus pahari TaxID=10093 RepID=UPI000A304F97|nr:histone H2A-Bbd type 1-like [Mus pahari]
MEDKRQKDSIAFSSGAELQFPVSKVEHLLQERNPSKRLNSSTSVVFTDMLKFVTSNILELTVKDGHTSCNKLIAPEQKSKSIENIDELCQLFKDSQCFVDGTPGPHEIPGSYKTTGLYATPRPNEK